VHDGTQTQNLSIVSVNTDADIAFHASENAGDQFGQCSRRYLTDQSRYIGMFHSSHRTTITTNTHATIAQMDATPESGEQNQESFIELDSHTDTSCIGANCCIIAYTDKVCSVSPYHPKYKSLENIPIVQAGTAYTDPNTGKTYILILNQSLYMGNALPAALLNLNQTRANNVIIDNVPRQFGGTHSIYIPQRDLHIPLQIKGVLSCLPVRRPTIEEIENCEWVELTPADEWDPKSMMLEEQEQAYQEELLPKARDRACTQS
jgi:hypothetical protein